MDEDARPQLPWIEDSERPQDNRDQFQLDTPTIALPKGGGAIKSIDETFSVNPSNGTAAMTVPLPLSAAREGFVPPIVARYDSGSGNGVMGLGWTLDLPAIRRRTDRGVPRYRGEEDVFLLAGAEDLVLAATWDGDRWSPDIRREGAYTVRRYRPRVVADFARIERIDHAEHGSWWRVTSRGNYTTVYGSSAASRIADPDDPTRVYQWLPAIGYDDRGNCTVYEYVDEDLAEVPQTRSESHRHRGLARFANKHLARVRYGNRTPYRPSLAQAFRPPPPPPPADFLFEAVFDYGAHDPDEPTPEPVAGRSWSSRPDPFSSYRSGFEIRTYRLLQRVLMFHRFDELDGGTASLVRSTDFDYDAPDVGGGAEVSLLRSVTQRGYVRNPQGRYAQRALPPVEMAYEPLQWGRTARTVDRDSVADLPVGAAGKYRFMDLDGEGIPGVFSEHGTAWSFKHNLGDVDEDGRVRLERTRLVLPKPAVTGMERGVLQLRELEANGRKHVVVHQPGLEGYFERRGDGWSEFRAFESTVRIDLRDQHVRMLDVDGDGRADVLVSEDDAFVWYRSRGTKGYAPAERAPKAHDDERGPAIVFAGAHQTIFLADMTGDGLVDIVRVRRGEVCYWPNLGYARFGAKVAMRAAPRLASAEEFDPSRIRLADVTGTGTTDLLYLGREACTIHLNLGGNAWSEGHAVGHVLPMTAGVDVSVVDLLGHGTACLVWSSSLPQHSHAPMRYVDLVGGRKPHLLRSYANNLGKEVSFSYRSSTWFYLKDKLAGRPWLTRLPFAVHCVQRIDVDDRIAGTRVSTRMRYHHGYYDSTEREFRGFGMVEQLDAERFEHWRSDQAGELVDSTLHQAPVLTKTWFHVGAFSERQQMLDGFRDEYWDRELARQGLGSASGENELPEAELTTASGFDPAAFESVGAEDWRQALRACKGTVLRTEVFALDAPAEGASADERRRELVPVTVSARNCVVQVLQPSTAGRHAVFAVQDSETVTWHYERELGDPRVDHIINVRIDEVGNVTESATVAYGRAIDDPAVPVAARAAQRRDIVVYRTHEFTDDATDDLDHRLRLESQSRVFELRGLSPAGPLFRASDFDRDGFHVLGDSVEVPHHEVDPTPVPGTVLRRVLGRTQTLYYAVDRLTPRPLGELDPRALVYERYQLALTPALRAEIFGAMATDALRLEGGYVTRGDGNWWVPSGRHEYLRPGELTDAAPARFYAPVALVDPQGSRTELHYLGNYALLPEEMRDAAGNRTRVERFDLRVLRPTRLVDANDNVTEVLLDELGWVKATAVLGKGHEADDLDGQTTWSTPAEEAQVQALMAADSSHEVSGPAIALLGRASARHVYDAHAYRDSGGTRPPVVATIVREQHVAVRNDSPVQVSFEYSNGMGRVELSKLPAEPGVALRAVFNVDDTVAVEQVDTRTLAPPRLRWLGTGRRVVNNKGNVVKEYEPFFAVSPGFETARELVEVGVTQISTYDAVDRLVQLEHPDGTFSRKAYRAWSTVEYDRNDTVLESSWHEARVGHQIDAELVALGKDPAREAQAATQTELHAGTPRVRRLDPRGRTLVESEQAEASAVPLSTVYRRDAQDRLTSVADARGNMTMTYVYDLRGEIIAYVSADSGRRTMLANVAANPMRSWDQRGHTFVFSYDDPLKRPTSKRVLGGDGDVPLNHQFERRIYGEGAADDKARNLRTKVVALYDTAGKVENLEFDFKGNLLRSRRRFAASFKEVPDWSLPDPDTRLEAEEFVSSGRYDALDRVAERTTADGSVYRPGYNEANLLETVDVSQAGAAFEPYIRSIDYNERGQRRHIVYANDVEMVHVYDRETFRLLRLTTRRLGGETLQDFHYTYDPVGNVTHLDDRSRPTMWFGGAQADGIARYRYDALYRLAEASGREHAGQVVSDALDNWSDVAFRRAYSANDPLAWRAYTQTFDYDGVGNLLQVQHVAGVGSWTRDYTYATGSNRLLSTRVGATDYDLEHHAQHGHVVSMPHLSRMHWSFRDELSAVATQVVNAGTPETTWYVYDGDGKRVRKVTEREAAEGAPLRRKSERVYLDGVEIYREYDGTQTLQLERQTLHVRDDQHLVALIERQTVGAGSGARLVRYQGIDHLGSSSLELDGLGRVISYELYHPFGTTAYQAVDKDVAAAGRRYRYTAMERDEESGLAYHGARYYAPWLGRWTAPDKHAEQLDGNRYAYVKNNPIVNRDPNGLYEEPVHGILTYRLALAAGFNEDEAARIAIATAGMDHDADTRPGHGVDEMVSQIFAGKTHQYHYPTQDEALARVENEVSNPSGPGGAVDLEAFGRHLHSLQDVGYSDAPGPHNRTDQRALSPTVGLLGMASLSGGAISAIFAAQDGASTGKKVGLGILAGVLLAFGLFLMIFAFASEGIGHPSYVTNRGATSSSFSTVADRGWQYEPGGRDRQETLHRRVYELLKRAARTHGHTTHNDALAEQAIDDIVEDDTAEELNDRVNARQTTATGGSAASYAEMVCRHAVRADGTRRWSPSDIDISLDEGEYQYQGPWQTCP